jgi:hypothetical protein
LDIVIGGSVEEQIRELFATILQVPAGEIGDAQRKHRQRREGNDVHVEAPHGGHAF